MFPTTEAGRFILLQYQQAALAQWQACGKNGGNPARHRRLTNLPAAGRKNVLA
jgi:hypothetical protein